MEGPEEEGGGGEGGMVEGGRLNDRHLSRRSENSYFISAHFQHNPDRALMVFLNDLPVIVAPRRPSTTFPCRYFPSNFSTRPGFHHPINDRDPAVPPCDPLINQQTPDKIGSTNSRLVDMELRCRLESA